MHIRKQSPLGWVIALALVASTPVRAESLIYVTPGFIGTVDSASPGSDNTPGGNGPLTYTLPEGYGTVAAKVSHADETLYLLASNGSECQLFAANLSGTSASLTAMNASYACSFPAGSVDFAFETGVGSSGSAGYLIAEGSDVQQVAAGGSTPATIAFTTPTGMPAALHALATELTASGAAIYGLEASGGGQLVQLNLANGTETAVQTVNIVTAGPTSLDVSPSSGAVYLLDNEGLAFAASSPTGTFEAIGVPPENTIALASGSDVVVEHHKYGGGSVGWLPCLALGAAVRLRRFRSRNRRMA